MSADHVTSYVLGVDAGNTKTLALAAHLDGPIAGAGRSGCGDIYGAASAEAALGAIEEAGRMALRGEGVEPEGLAASGFSLAGADWPEDFDFLRLELARRGFHRNAVIVNDAMGGLRAGSPDGTGVAVVCGTGTATGARSPDGRSWHTSHWQEFHCGHELGDRALRAVYRAELGIDGPTALTDRILEFYGQPTVEDVLHLFTARVRKPPQEERRLTRLLLDEAERGDATARRIVCELGVGLGDYALVAARRVGIERTAFTLVLTGGVFRHPGKLLSEAVIGRVRTTSPEIQSVNSRLEPVVGALFLAFEAAGIVVDEPLLQRLLPTLPPVALYET